MHSIARAGRSACHRGMFFALDVYMPGKHSGNQGGRPKSKRFRLSTEQTAQLTTLRTYLLRNGPTGARKAAHDTGLGFAVCATLSYTEIGAKGRIVSYKLDNGGHVRCTDDGILYACPEQNRPQRTPAAPASDVGYSGPQMVSDTSGTVMLSHAVRSDG